MSPDGNATVVTNFGRPLEICYYGRPNFGFPPFKEIVSPNCFSIGKNGNITRSATPLHTSTVGRENSSCILIYGRNYIKEDFFNDWKAYNWS